MAPAGADGGDDAGWMDSGPACRPDPVCGAGTLNELSDAADLLTCQPQPSGRRTAVFATSPAACRDAAAALEEADLLLADVTQHTELRTRLVMPEVWHTGGLISVPCNTDLSQMGTALSTLADDPGVDAIVTLIEPPPGHTAASLATMLNGVSADHPDVTIISATSLGRGSEVLKPGHVPSVQSVASAARAVSSSGLPGATAEPSSRFDGPRTSTSRYQPRPGLKPLAAWSPGWSSGSSLAVDAPFQPPRMQKCHRDPFQRTPDPSRGSHARCPCQPSR